MRSHEFVSPMAVDASTEVASNVEEIARAGGTPLVVAENSTALGVIYLKDIVKGGMQERFADFARWESGPS